MVFVAFTQHCIQSTDFMSETLEILHSVYSGPSPLQGGGYLFQPSTCCIIGQQTNVDWNALVSLVSNETNTDVRMYT